MLYKTETWMIHKIKKKKENHMKHEAGEKHGKFLGQILKNEDLYLTINKRKSIQKKQWKRGNNKSNIK